MIVLLVLQAGQLLSQVNDWNLVSDQDTLQIYTRRSEVSSIKEVKIEARVQCELKEIVAALEDIPTQKDWLIRTKEIRYVEEQGPGRFSYYLSTDMPFPVKDRDIVVNYERSYDQNKGEVLIEYQELGGLVPINKSHVRIPEMKASYKLSSPSEGMAAIEYYLYIDAGGALPNWVVNFAITKGPKETMDGLFDIVYSGKYKGTDVPGLTQ